MSQIFEDGTNNLLGEARLLVTGTGKQDLNNPTFLNGSDTIDVSTDAVRIKTYGLVVGGNISTNFPLHSFFHEFETTPVDRVLKGDVNLDGAVTLFDINPFIQALVANAFQAEADSNCDGAVDFFDINPFIQILMNTATDDPTAN